jgi:hypothetical protein
MSLRTPVQAQITGAVSTKTAAASGGDTFAPGDLTFDVANGHATLPRTVTVAVPGNSKYGQANPDVAVVIAALTSKAIGPFPADLADPTDGLVHVTYSDAAADLTVSLVRN